MEIEDPFGSEEEAAVVELEPGVELVEEEGEYDLLFPTIPPEDDPYPEEIEGELLDDIEEFAADEGSAEAEDELDEEEQGPEGEEGEDAPFDFETGEFYMAAPGQPERVDADQAVIEWCMKAVTIPRGEYAIYPPEYGCDLYTIVGAPLPAATLHSEAGRMIRECLLFHPRVARVEVEYIGPRYEVDANGLFIDASIWLDTDEDEPVQLELIV